MQNHENQDFPYSMIVANCHLLLLEKLMLCRERGNFLLCLEPKYWEHHLSEL